MTLVFHPRTDPDLESVDAKHLSWHQLANSSTDEINSLPLGLGFVRDYFDVERVNDGKNVWRVSAGVAWLSNLGHRLSGAELIVDGDAGSHLGSMQNGGRIVVYGDVGCYAGYRARRGEIWVAGTVGRHAGAQMIAGTLVADGVSHGNEMTLGFGARRGSFVIRRCPDITLSASIIGRKYIPTWLRLLHQPDEAFGWLDPTAEWLRRRLPQASSRAELICRDS